jgi:hypothetical protein
MAIFALLALCTALPAAAQKDTAQWTFLMYMSADNNLEPNMMGDLYELAQVGSTDEVNIIVQVDRAKGYDDESYGNWTETRRYRVEQGMDFATAALQTLGETDTSDPATFAEFLEWGVTNYPAERYMLAFSNHGAGWRGLGTDKTSHPAMLTMDEISAVMRDAQKRGLIDRIDLLAFDACLMAQLDVMHMAAQFADYTLAAEELHPGDERAGDQPRDDRARTRHGFCRYLHGVLR